MYVCVFSDQVSVDESVLLQMLHSLTHVVADSQQVLRSQRSSPLPQVVEQAAQLHELRHQVDGLLLGTNAVQLHQVTVRQIPAGTRDT